MGERNYLRGVTIRDLSEFDRDRLPGLNFDSMLEDGYKILECESLFCVVSKSDYEAFGRERICDVVYAEWSEFCEEYFLKIDWEKIANDLEFNKPLEINVSFVKELPGAGEMLYKAENGKYYIRQDNPREECAVWLSAFKHKGEWIDGAAIRPNVTFVLGTERETVTYSNWAGSGVWSGYNKAFLGKSLAEKIVEAIHRSDEVSQVGAPQRERAFSMDN